MYAPSNSHLTPSRTLPNMYTQVLAIYYAMHDPRTPWLPKAIAFVILAYALR